MNFFSWDSELAPLIHPHFRTEGASIEVGWCSSALEVSLVLQTNLLGIRMLEGHLCIDFLPCSHKMILYFASGRFCGATGIRLVALILPSFSFQTKVLQNQSAELSCRGDHSRIDPDMLDAQRRIKGRTLSRRKPFSNVEVRLVNLNKHSCGFDVA